MRLPQAIITLAACSLLQGSAFAAYTITWGNEVDSVNLSSDTLSSSWAAGFTGYTFKMGTFGSYVPVAGDETNWGTNWKTLSTGSYNAAAGYFAGEALLANNTQFAANEKVYIWAYKTPNANFGTQTPSNIGVPSALFGSEWLLLTDNDWKVPTVPADQQQTLLPLAFDVICSQVVTSDVIFGGANATGPGVQGAGDYTDPGSIWCLQSHAYTTVNTGNTVTLQNDNVTPDSWSVTLNGGKLSTGGVTDSAGVFKLTNSSIIDFANGGLDGSFLTFLSTNTSDWDGKRLQVWNWTGVINTPGGVDELKYTSHSGPSYFLGNQVQFYSDNGVTPIGWGAKFYGAELVPIPEASTVAGVLSLLGLIGWRERRYFLRCREARELATGSC